MVDGADTRSPRSRKTAIFLTAVVLAGVWLTVRLRVTYNLSHEDVVT